MKLEIFVFSRKERKGRGEVGILKGSVPVGYKEVEI